MTPDLAWWEQLATFLLAQTALLLGVAALAHSLFHAPKARRAVWLSAVLGAGCLWIGEVAGLGEKARALLPHEAGELVRSADFRVTTTTAATGVTPTNRPLRLAAEQPAPAMRWPGVIWLSGTLLLLLRAAGIRGWLAWQRRQMPMAGAGTQEAVSRLQSALGLARVETRIWSRLRGPVAFGTLRPTVALPRDFCQRFSAAQQEAMLAHELAHLAARDPFFLALADAVCALAWWNPLVWFGTSQLRAACETAADEATALVASGPSALAESLLLFGRELAESGPARGLGVAGDGFRSGLGRRVKILLTNPVRWQELPALGRWSPRILAAIFVLGLTELPVLNGPPGSLVGIFAASAQAETKSQDEDAKANGTAGAGSTLSQENATPRPRPGFQWGVFDNSKSPPLTYDFRDGTNQSNGIKYILAEGQAPKKVHLEIKIARILEGSPAQIAADKFFSRLPLDLPGGPADIARFLADAHIVHTENARVDCLLTKEQSVALRAEQFKAMLDSFERQTGSEILSSPQVTQFSGREAQIAVENIQQIVTGVVPAGIPGPGGATNTFVTDQLDTGFTAKFLSTMSADGWDLSVTARETKFLGYDNPGPTAKGLPVLPLPRIAVNEIQGHGTVLPGETLLLRGAGSETNTITDSVLGIYHHTRTEVVQKRLYLFVTPTAGSK